MGEPDLGPRRGARRPSTLQRRHRRGVYFCDPRSPWQRGTNENTNGLLRQYFPKWTNLSIYSQTDLDAVAARLNARPRKTLEYQTPAAMLAAIVASTP